MSDRWQALPMLVVKLEGTVLIRPLSRIDAYEYASPLYLVDAYEYA
jgi:hypothetical protein